MNETMELPTPDNNSERKGLTEQETINFLKSRGIEPLGEFKPGEPLLYVLEEMVRADDGPFKWLPASERPNVVRMDSPEGLNLDKPLNTEDPNRIVYVLKNKFGKADFYTINSQTGIPKFVATESKLKAYQVRKNLLYSPNDELFPKAE